MVRRSIPWEVGLREELQDMEFAKGFILAALDEGVPLKYVLSKTIRTYGVKEFSELTGIHSSNLVRFMSETSNPTEKTYNRILNAFNLELGASPITTKKSA